jgi:hypothetical protein
MENGLGKVTELIYLKQLKTKLMAHCPQNQWHETLEYVKTNNTSEFTHVLQMLQAVSTARYSSNLPHFARNKVKINAVLFMKQKATISNKRNQGPQRYSNASQTKYKYTSPERTRVCETSK